MALLLARTALLCLPLGLLAPATAGPRAPEGPFLDLSFEAALERAGAEDKLLLVAFYQDDCPVCDSIDSLTLTESRVRSWMVENMLAVRVDPDRPDLAERYEVNARPTLVIVDAKGDALERMDGFRKPGAFLRFASVAREGNGFLTVERAYQASPSDPEARLRYGRLLVRRQRGPEALEHLLYAFDTTRGDPAWTERRLDEVLREISMLQRSTEGVQGELVKRRDRNAAALLEDYDPEMPEAELVLCATELAAINRIVAQNEQTTFTWTIVRKREGYPEAAVRALFNTYVETELLNEGRYAELLESWGDPAVRLNALLAEYYATKERAQAHPEEKINLRRELNAVLSEARKYYEALLSTGNDAAADELAGMLMALANDDQTYVTLVTAAFKAGRDEKAEALIEVAKDNIARGKERESMLQVFLRLRANRQRTLERAEAERREREAEKQAKDS